MPPAKANKKNTKPVKGKKQVKKPVEHARNHIDMNQQIYISVPRITNRIDKYGLNERITNAHDELRRGEPRTIEDEKTKEKVEIAQVPLESMSLSTQTILEEARVRYSKTQTKRNENLVKKKATLTEQWDVAQLVMADNFNDNKAGKRGAELKAVEEAYKTELETAKTKFNTEIAAIEADLKTSPQLINKKKQNHTVYEEQMAYLQKLRYRISRDVSTAAAAAATIWVSELLRHGMNNVVLQEKSFLKCQHIFTDDLNNLQGLPFYQCLPSFLAAQEAETTRKASEEEKKRERTKKKKAAAEAKKAAAEAGTVVAAAAEEKEAVADEKEAEVDDDEDDDHSVKFNHHVKQVCLYLQRTMENEDMSEEQLLQFQSIRISEEIKTFCSNLISEFCGTLINLLRAELNKTSVTTVNVTHVTHVLGQFLICNSADPKSFITEVERLTSAYKKHQDEKNEERKVKQELKKKAEAEDNEEEADTESTVVEAS